MIYIKGNIVNKSGQLITTPGIFYLIDSKSGETTPPTTNEDGTFKIYSAPEFYYSFVFVIEFEGYAKKIVPIAQLPETSEGEATIELEKENSQAAIITAAALLLFLLTTKNKKGKVGALTVGDVTPYIVIVIALYGFGIIDKVLQALGLSDSKDTKDLDNAATDPYSFWSPTFWQKKPANIPWTYSIDRTQAIQYGNDIIDAFGFFDDDESAVKSIFRLMRTQANVSYLAYVFQQEEGKDLLSYLRGGIWPKDRLSDSDVNEINQFISQLPKY